LIKNKISNKNLEIFCGTGGVGKTTLATSRALFLGSQGQKVLLITIDPAKRLKQILNINDKNAGKIEEISSSYFEHFNEQNFTISALLMSPKETLKKVINLDKIENNVLKILTRPHGGMNEILSLVEVQLRIKEGLFDTIILDTPPGKHFIDFLQSARKISDFFDSSFVEIFKFLGKPILSSSDSSQKPSKKLLSKIISTGIKKLLKYLDKVTGEKFVIDFVEAVSILYQNKASFLDALNLEKKLRKSEFSNWFLITSVEQSKLREAAELHSYTENFHKDNFYLIINKSLENYLKQWDIPPESETLSGDTREKLISLKSAMIIKEEKIKTFAKNHFGQFISFPEIIDLNPGKHVGELAKEWPKTYPFSKNKSGE
jgi:anion-transporting  ArsA/GET3 family ATPase